MYLFSKCLVPKGLQEKVQETLELELQTVAASMWVLKKSNSDSLGEQLVLLSAEMSPRSHPLLRQGLTLKSKLSHLLGAISSLRRGLTLRLLWNS